MAVFVTHWAVTLALSADIVLDATLMIMTTITDTDDAKDPCGGSFRQGHLWSSFLHESTQALAFMSSSGLLTGCES